MIYNQNMRKLISVTLLVTALPLLLSACAGASAVKGAPVIYELSADRPRLYPHTTAELKCVALDPENEDLFYKWSSTDGSISGDGPIVSWKAPDSYGDYHIMVLVEDVSGHTVSATITLDVIPNPNPGCKTCGKQ
jgi:hypothetical protein